MPFVDRADAGRRLAVLLEHLRGPDVVVLGLPRGGVPVAFEVARALGAPLDVIVVRKLGVPFQPELAMGAVGEEGARVVDEEVQHAAGVSAEEFAAVEARERAELERRVRRFRGDRPAVPVAGRTAIVVDDGIATGSTARAACQVARAHGAARVVLAVPVAPRESVAELRDAADEVVCVEMPRSFFAIGQFYEDFTQTGDNEVVALLEQAADWQALVSRTTGDAGGSSGPTDPPLLDMDLTVPVGPGGLSGHLTVPAAATGLVVFAHGSGSSRHSPRNRFVAAVLNRDGLATLLFDLLTPEEELDRANVFDIALLGDRLVEVTRWLRKDRGHLVVAHRVLRREHRRRGRSVGRGRARLGDRGGRLPRRPPRPGRRATGVRHRADPPHRGRSRRSGVGPQSQGTCAAALRAQARDRPGRDPSLRGARHPRGRRLLGERVVHQTHGRGVDLTVTT